ncbi:hypothetical protein BDN72DRAFT_355893 [Pluteus cervinus]|uniref:Uncharacterized protein n=1 Tax=Pluteus cervinus TaxID=181527 RepID=A0ACD3BE72_9AGAR|nr:hypothetical protein BDN72DRAFT_355893 [Pluteus cervinus]
MLARGLKPTQSRTLLFINLLHMYYSSPMHINHPTHSLDAFFPPPHLLACSLVCPSILHPLFSSCPRVLVFITCYPRSLMKLYRILTFSLSLLSSRSVSTPRLSLNLSYYRPHSPSYPPILHLTCVCTYLTPRGLFLYHGITHPHSLPHPTSISFHCALRSSLFLLSFFRYQYIYKGFSSFDLTPILF